MAELSSNWKKLQATLSDRKQTKAPTGTTKATRTKNLVKGGTARPIGIRKLVEKRGALDFALKGHQSPSKMGSVQSSQMCDDRQEGRIASAELWTQNHDTSSESLAEVYDLGIKDIPLFMMSHNDRVNHGRSPNVNVGKYVALDCEMVGIGAGGHESALARVSVVDFHGRQVYDSYVKPTERVTDWRSHVSGVSSKEMRFARNFIEVQKDISSIIRGRILVGHDIKHDLEALRLPHPLRDVRDTAKHLAFRKFGNGRKPALRNLARELLGLDIQKDVHSSTEDARTTMLLFRRNKSTFDNEHANRYRQIITTDRRKGPKQHKQRR